MKKFLFLAGMVFLLSPAFANEPALLQIRSIQSQIDDCGAKILNANQITKPVIFVYIRCAGNLNQITSFSPAVPEECRYSTSP